MVWLRPPSVYRFLLWTSLRGRFAYMVCERESRPSPAWSFSQYESIHGYNATCREHACLPFPQVRCWRAQHRARTLVLPCVPGGGGAGQPPCSNAEWNFKKYSQKKLNQCFLDQKRHFFFFGCSNVELKHFKSCKAQLKGILPVKTCNQCWLQPQLKLLSFCLDLNDIICSGERGSPWGLGSGLGRGCVWNLLQILLW